MADTCTALVIEEHDGQARSALRQLTAVLACRRRTGGGCTRYQRVKAEWPVALPDAFTPLQAMAIGAAGCTAALCVDALERWGHAKPGQGAVLVTGAAGGVVW